MIALQTKEGRDVCITQQESNSFSLRTAAVNRRHSADGTIGSGAGSAPGRGPVEPDRFHPYRRQFSDGAVTAAGCLQQCSTSFSCLQEVCSPDTRSHSSSSEAPTSWDQYNGSFQVSRLLVSSPVILVKALCNPKQQVDIRKMHIPAHTEVIHWCSVITNIGELIPMQKNSYNQYFYNNNVSNDNVKTM